MNSKSTSPPKTPATQMAAAPRHLKPVERKLWDALVSENVFDDAASLALLRSALESHQRARLCREVVDKDGATFRDRFDQIKAHPLLATERDARAAFILAMKTLNLDIVGAST